MPLTPFQRNLCRLIAHNRIAQGEVYVAGGVALTVALGSARVSRDIDLFHDSHESLATTFANDQRLLQEDRYQVDVLHERPTYVEAVVSKTNETVVVQWACDSAYRFFPLVEHPDFGLVLHPFDLATNKVLALVGRAEARDWIDTMDCHRLLQPFGYLIWAACGKDPSLSPAFILEQARRNARYTQAELAELAFDGPVPNAADLAVQWKAMIAQADGLHAILPVGRVGCCVFNADLKLYAGDATALSRDLAEKTLIFHEGAIGGVWPRLLTGVPRRN